MLEDILSFKGALRSFLLQHAFYSVYRDYVWIILVGKFDK